MQFLVHRDVHRRRYDVSPRVLLLLRPFFRYSGRRQAWVLRAVGRRYGPVLRAQRVRPPTPTTTTPRRPRADRRPAAPSLRWLTESRARVAVLAGCAVVVAAVLGFIGARSAASGSSSSHTSHSVSKLVSAGLQASAGLLAVSIPPGWQLQSAQNPPQPGLTDEIAAADGRRLIVVGRAATTDPSLLPTGILDAVQGTPAVQLVTLGGATFYRYLNLSLKGQAGVESVYAVPTQAGTVLTLCRTPVPDAGFASICQKAVASIRLSSGSLAPGLLTGYATGLGAAIHKLDTARASLGAQLSRSRRAGVRARAARQLAAAHSQAAAAVAALSAGPASGANAALAAALRADAQAYTALARAAAHKRVRAYHQAAAAVARADRSLASAQARLQAFGYRVS